MYIPSSLSENTNEYRCVFQVYPAYDYCSSRVHNRPEHLFSEIGTQTSPTESRSSSFTWISDCSEDDHSSTTSSTEDSRRVGDSSGDSTPIKDEPESGIGTASPPRHYKYNKRKFSLFLIEAKTNVNK